ncbi:MAG: hypothetical protein HYV27_15035 [Candidatus Hydrogenedentes bacterium]|nr:hypothetical protein [Candidatus Hydrogenedentota bacterium]
MRIRYRLAFFAPAMILLCATTWAEEGAPVPPVVDPRLTQDDDAYLNRQAQSLLATVDETLAAHPPVVPEPLERRLALAVMDGLLHDVYAPNRPPIQAFYQRRIEQLTGAMEATQVQEGARIWKLYNHGFIVRTATVTLGFDLHRGVAGFRVNDPKEGKSSVPSPGFPIRQDFVERIARQCDVLFISHLHRDHADDAFAQAFIDQGKPVVAPPGVFPNSDLATKLTVLPREAGLLQRLPIQNGARELELVVYPGQQYQSGGPPNNVVLVFTPEKMSFAHNGDQINDPYPEYQEDFKWIDQVHEKYDVDVLMTNCWTNDIFRFTRGFDPKLVLPGHQNELGHPIWDRVPYWGDAEFLKLNYPELLASDYPVLVMTWGESYHYIPAMP